VSGSRARAQSLRPGSCSSRRLVDAEAGRSSPYSPHMLSRSHHQEARPSAPRSGFAPMGLHEPELARPPPPPPPPPSVPAVGEEPPVDALSMSATRRWLGRPARGDEAPVANDEREDDSYPASQLSLSPVTAGGARRLDRCCCSCEDSHPFARPIRPTSAYPGEAGAPHHSAPEGEIYASRG
jgi:hypothetical protein